MALRVSASEKVHSAVHFEQRVYLATTGLVPLMTVETFFASLKPFDASRLNTICLLLKLQFNYIIVLYQNLLHDLQRKSPGVTTVLYIQSNEK